MKAHLVNKTTTAEYIGKELAEQFEKTQKVVFTNWINFNLAPQGIVVNDIYEELKDGVILYKLLGILTGKRLPSLRHATIISKRLDNLNMCLRLIESQKVSNFNVDIHDIEQGHYKVILALLYALWVHFEGREINSSVVFKQSEAIQPDDYESLESEPINKRYSLNSPSQLFSSKNDFQDNDIQNEFKRHMSFSHRKKSPKGISKVQKSLDVFEDINFKSKVDAVQNEKNPSIRTQILDACNVITKNYGLTVDDVLNSCKDGRVFMALIHYFDPSLVDFDSISPDKGQDNIKQAIQIAKQKLRINASFEPEEFLKDTNIDETGPIAFISSLLLTINNRRNSLVINRRRSIQSFESLIINDDDKKLFDDTENITKSGDKKNVRRSFTRSQTISEPVSSVPKEFEENSSLPHTTSNVGLEVFNEPIDKKKQMPNIYVLANKLKYRLNMQEINQEAGFWIWPLNNELTDGYQIYSKSLCWSETGTQYSQNQIVPKDEIKIETSITKNNDGSNGILKSKGVTVEGDMENIYKTKWRKRFFSNKNTTIPDNEDEEDKISKNKEYSEQAIIKETTKELIPTIKESTIYRKATLDDTISDQKIPIQIINSPDLIKDQNQATELIVERPIVESPIVERPIVKSPIVERPIITCIIPEISFPKKVDNQFNNIPESMELTSAESDNKKLIYIVNAIYENDKLQQEYQQWLKEKIKQVIKLKISFKELNTEKEANLLEDELKILSESLIELVKRRNDDYRGVEYYEQNIFVRCEHLGQKIKFKITKDDLFKEWKELFEMLKTLHTLVSSRLELKFKAEQVEQSILSKIDLWETILNQFDDCFDTSVDLTAFRSLSEKYTEFVSKCNVQLENDIIVISVKEEIKIRLQKLDISFNRITNKYKSINAGIFLDNKDFAIHDKRSKLLLRKGSQIYDSIQNLILQKSNPSIQENEFLFNLIKEEYQDYQNKVMKYKDNLAPEVIELCKQLAVTFKTANEGIIYSNKFLQWKNETKEICRKVKRLEQIFKVEKTNAFEFFYNISSKIKLFKAEELKKKLNKIKLKAKQSKESRAEFIESANIDKDYLLKKELKFDNAMIKLNTLSDFINRSYESFNSYQKICFDYNELMINMSNYMLGSYERSVKMLEYLPEDYDLAIASLKKIGSKYHASYKLLETNIKLFSSNFKSLCEDYIIEKTEVDAKIIEVESTLKEKYLKFSGRFAQEDNKLEVYAKLYIFNQKANQLALKLIEDNVNLTSVGNLVCSDSANILKTETIEPINNKISNIKTKIMDEYTPELASINRLLITEDHSFTTLKEFTHPKISSLTQMISSIKISLDDTVALLNQLKSFTDIIVSCENMKQAMGIFYQRYWSSSYFYRNVLRTKLISDIRDVLKKGKYLSDSEYYTRDSILENCKRAIYNLNEELNQIINLKCLTKIIKPANFKILFKKNFLWWYILLFKANLFFDFDLTMHDADYRFDFFTELNDELVNYGYMYDYFISFRKTNNISFDAKVNEELLGNIVLLEKLDSSIKKSVDQCAIYLKKASKSKKLNLANKNIKVLSYFTTNAIKFIHSEISKSNNQLSVDGLLQLNDVESLLKKHNTTYNESLKALKHPGKTENTTTIETLKNVEILINGLNEAKKRANQKVVFDSLLKQITQTEAYVKNRNVSCSYENFYCIYLKKCLAHSIAATQMKRKGNSIVDLLSNIKAYIERKDMGFETVSVRYSKLCLSLNEVKKIVEEENKCTSFNYVKDDIPLYISLQKYEITYAEMFVKIFLKKSTTSQSNCIATEGDSKIMALIKYSKKLLDSITKLENSTEMVELQEQMNKTIQLYDDHEIHFKGSCLFDSKKGILDYIEKWLTVHLTDIKTLLSLEINSTNISRANEQIKILTEIFDVKNSKLVSDTLNNCKKLDGDFLKDIKSDELKILTDGLKKIDTFIREIKNCCTEVEKKMKFETNKYMIESELEMWEVIISTLYNSHSTKITEDNFADIIKRIGEYNYKINFNNFFLNSTMKALNDKYSNHVENDKENLSSLKARIENIGKNCSDIQLSLSKDKEKLAERCNFVQVQKEHQSFKSNTDTSYLNILRIDEYIYTINYYINENNLHKEDYATLKESFELQNAVLVSFGKQSKSNGKSLHNEWIFSTSILIKHITEAINDMNCLSKTFNQPFSIIQKVQYDFILMNFYNLNSWIQATRSNYDKIITSSYSLDNASKNDTSNRLKTTNDLLTKKLDEMNNSIIFIERVINSQKITCTFLSRVNNINCHAAYLCHNIRRKIPPESISECLTDLSTHAYRLPTIRQLHLVLSKLKFESQKLDSPKNLSTIEIKPILSNCESLIESLYSDFNVLSETLRIEFNAFVISHDISKLSTDISELIKTGKTLMTKTVKTGLNPPTNIVYQYIVEFLNNQCITQKTALIEDGKAVSDLVNMKVDTIKRKIDIESDTTNEKIIYDKFSFIVPKKYTSLKKNSNKEYPLLLSGYFLMKKIDRIKNKNVENLEWQLYVFGMYKKAIYYFSPTNATRITSKSSGIFKSLVTSIKFASGEHQDILLNIQFKDDGEYMLWFNDTNERKNFSNCLDTMQLLAHK